MNKCYRSISVLLSFNMPEQINKSKYFIAYILFFTFNSRGVIEKFSDSSHQKSKNHTWFKCDLPLNIMSLCTSDHFQDNCFLKISPSNSFFKLQTCLARKHHLLCQIGCLLLEDQQSIRAGKPAANQQPNSSFQWKKSQFHQNHVCWTFMEVCTMNSSPSEWIHCLRLAALLTGITLKVGSAKFE